MVIVMILDITNEMLKTYMISLPSLPCPSLTNATTAPQLSFCHKDVDVGTMCTMCTYLISVTGIITSTGR